VLCELFDTQLFGVFMNFQNSARLICI
jgi:hypothetical protein